MGYGPARAARDGRGVILKESIKKPPDLGGLMLLISAVEVILFYTSLEA